MLSNYFKSKLCILVKIEHATKEAFKMRLSVYEAAYTRY